MATIERRGVSLVEILVVVTLVLIVVALVIPPAPSDCGTVSTRSTLRSEFRLYQFFFDEHGRWPTQQEMINSVYVDPSYFQGKDRWGRQIEYGRVGDGCYLRSLGPDRWDPHDDVTVYSAELRD